MKKKKSISYEAGLKERLKDAHYAALYLSESLLADQGGEAEAFLVALRDVAVSHGMTELAEETELSRESLYKTLSESGNPRWKSILSILTTLGFEMAIVEKSEKKRRQA